MNPSEVYSYLNSLTNFESQLHTLGPEDFNLNRIHKFLDLAGDPGKNLKIAHVAGTKGKGSTCAFLSAILQEAGYKVGLYTSPHLHKVTERIRILNAENKNSKEDFSGSIRDADLAAVLSYLRPFAADIQNEGSILTYFEVLTVAALYYFAQQKVDIVVLETGLGGRLDATNAVNAAVAVITPISMDHTRILGPTLAKIASEKSGIIKNTHQKVVIAPQDKEAMDVLLKRCQEFGIHPQLVDSRSGAHLKTGLKGGHQLINAATAVETIKILKTLGFRVSDEHVIDGLKHVHWPGRLEVVHRHPTVVVDCAHNEASAEALAEALVEIYPRQRQILVLGISRDKDIEAMVSIFKEHAAQIYLTHAHHPRAHVFTPLEAEKYFGDKPVGVIDDLNEALDTAIRSADPKDDVIVVTGSVFVAAQAREHLCTSTKV